MINAGDTNPHIEICEKDVLYKIKRISQFGVIPDVVIHIKKRTIP